MSRIFLSAFISTLSVPITVFIALLIAGILRIAFIDTSTEISDIVLSLNSLAGLAILYSFFAGPISFVGTISYLVFKKRRKSHKVIMGFKRFILIGGLIGIFISIISGIILNFNTAFEPDHLAINSYLAIVCGVAVSASVYFLTPWCFKPNINELV